MNFFKTIEAQEFGQLKSIDAVALVGVFGNPGIGGRMRTDNALNQRADNGGDPGGQLARFQVHLNITAQISECLSQISFAGRKPAIVANCPDRIDGYLLKHTRPEIESDVNLVHADVSSLKQVLEKAGSLSCWRHLRLTLNLEPDFHRTIGPERRERVSYLEWCGEG